MATIAELRAEKARLETEEQRLRVEYERFSAEISRLIDEQSSLSRELRAQRAIITDPNATQAQKDAAVQRGIEIEEQLRASDAQIRSVRDQQNNFLEQQLRPVQNRLYSPSGINNEIQRAETAEKAQADQGPGTESAGATVAQDQQANAEGADTQDPESGALVANDQGDIEAVTATVPSNADPSVAPLSAQTDAPDTLPNGFGRADDGSFQINIDGVGSVPATPPANILQVSNRDLETPEINNNLVSYIYMTTRVVSSFSQGKFTQELEGAQVFFTLPPRPTTRTATEQDTRLRNTPIENAPSVPQGTVATAVATPGQFNTGVIYDDQVGAEFAAYEDVGAIPGAAPDRPPVSGPSSILEAEGFTDPTAEQSDTVAPLASEPPTTNGADIAPPSASSQTGLVDLQSQLTLARANEAAFVRLLAETDQRIAAGQGNPAVNRDLRQLYQSNLNRERSIIANLEAQLSSPTQSTSNTARAPQQGAKEY